MSINNNNHQQELPLASDPGSIMMSNFPKHHRQSQQYHVHKDSQHAFIANIQLDQNGFQTVEQGEQRNSPMISGGGIPWGDKEIPAYQKRVVAKKKKAKTPIAPGRTSRTAVKSKRPGTTMSTQEAESTDLQQHNFLTSSMNNRKPINRAKFTQRAEIDLGAKAKSSTNLHRGGSALRKAAINPVLTRKKTGALSQR